MMNSLHLIFAAFYLLLITHTESALISWNISDTTIPANVYEHACGYDASTKSIFIYGGWVNTEITETLNAYSYNVETHNTQSFISFTNAKKIDFIAPAYINAPYWYFLRNNKFGKFVPSSVSPNIVHPISSWTSNQTPTPTTNAQSSVYACITISSDGDNLIVTGGLNSNSIKDMQIYDIVLGTWTNGGGPDMNTRRDSHGCVVSNNNILYVIGGYSQSTQSSGDIDTIETIDISNINILPTSWDINTNTGYKLTSTKQKMNCVLYGSNIYVIGGENLNGANPGSLVDVDIIDTTTHMVTSGPPLPIDIFGACSVIVNDKIYVLGGYEADPEFRAVNTIIISNILLYPTSTDYPTTNIPTTLNPTTNVPTTNTPTTMSPTTNSPTTNLPTTNVPTTFIPTTTFPTTNMLTTHLPTTNLPTTNAPTTFIPTTNVPTTTFPTTLVPTTHLPTSNTVFSSTTTTESGIDHEVSEYSVKTTDDDKYQLNDVGTNTFYILYIIVGVISIVVIMVIGIVIYCVCRNKKKFKNNKGTTETHTVMTRVASNSPSVVEMHVKSNEITPIEPLTTLTPNGDITPEYISDTNKESDDESEEGMYSQPIVQVVSTPKYDQTKGENAMIDTQHSHPDEDDMYKETNIVTKGADHIETPK